MGLDEKAFHMDGTHGMCYEGVDWFVGCSSPGSYTDSPIDSTTDSETDSTPGVYEEYVKHIITYVRLVWFCKNGFTNKLLGFPFSTFDDSAKLDCDIFTILYMYYVLHIKTYSVSLFYEPEPLSPRLNNIVLRELESKYKDAEDFLKHAVTGPYPKALFVP